MRITGRIPDEENTPSSENPLELSSKTKIYIYIYKSGVYETDVRSLMFILELIPSGRKYMKENIYYFFFPYGLFCYEIDMEILCCCNEWKQ